MFLVAVCPHLSLRSSSFRCVRARRSPSRKAASLSTSRFEAQKLYRSLAQRSTTQRSSLLAALFSRSVGKTFLFLPMHSSSKAKALSCPPASLTPSPISDFPRLPHRQQAKAALAALEVVNQQPTVPKIDLAPLPGAMPPMKRIFPTSASKPGATLVSPLSSPRRRAVSSRARLPSSISPVNATETSLSKLRSPFQFL